MIHVQRNQGRTWDVQVVSIGDRIAFAGVSLPGIALLTTLKHLGESSADTFANGLILSEEAVEMAFDAIDAAGLITLTLG